VARGKQGAEFVGVVVAAGRSTRFGGARAKQFLDLCGQSVLERSIGALAAPPSVKGVVVVLAPEEVEGPRAAGLKGRRDVLAVVAGGQTRAESVRAGLSAVGDEPFVLIHDAARPLASPQLVEAVMDATRRHGAAIPGLRVPDTVKRLRASDDGHEGSWVDETLEREVLRLAQTPQGARADWLREALDALADEGGEVTDESAALERAGHRVAVVPGDAGNRKITSAEDLDDARRRVTGGEPGLRIGSGFDIHRFGAGRRLMLGGIEFPGEEGLEGHSDADVVLHAVMDALLGAAGMGDIGVLFPPEDERFAGADSRILAAQVARAIAERGYRVVNVDLTLLAERPKIRSRAQEMRSAIAGAIEVSSDRIGIKATTLERLGSLGRGEGIACQAVALLSRTESP
jgi:2-C-methyl-D-erythritol 4-phosphate cytidylyltransferase/2-C-methyl-D-erythritol 2,4-cyclodiphosphate synthase